ncbi:MAG: fused DSP-PTPase phosphatase/NAD kinase-like protein [Phycisphaerae bacterium]
MAGLFVVQGVYELTLGDNFHAIVPGLAYRCAQPGPSQLRRWTERYGLRTVINLRGKSSRDFYAAERAAAEELGLRMVDVRLSAMGHPPRPQLMRLIEALENSPRPVLLHCRAGADRTGLAAVLAAMAIGGQDYATAREQLSWQYGHIDDHTDRIAGLLHRYERFCSEAGIDTGGWEQFRRWASEEYHPHYYLVEIETPERLSAAPGRRITVPLTVTNRSCEAIPAGDDERLFAVAAFLGSSIDDMPDDVLSPRAWLPQRDIRPGESVRLEVLVDAPRREGEYTVRFDMVEEHETWFARQGSPMGQCELSVSADANR